MGRSPGDQYRVDALDEMPRIERVDLARARRAAAHTGGGAHTGFRTQNHRAAGAMRVECRVTDRDARNGCDILSHTH